MEPAFTISSPGAFGSGELKKLGHLKIITIFSEMEHLVQWIKRMQMKWKTILALEQSDLRLQVFMANDTETDHTGLIRACTVCSDLSVTVF